MNFGIYPELTKKYILEKISQEAIMERYLGITVTFGDLVKNPKRIDNNPTCSFYYTSSNKLKFRDLSGYFWGDCFDVCAKEIGVDSGSKRGFMFVLHTIAKDFRIHKYEDYKEVIIYDKKTNIYFNEKKEKIKTAFYIVYRPYNNYDINYWSTYNVNINLLKAGKVYVAKEIYISKNGQDFSLLYTYKTKDPAYCYYGGKTKGSIDWKIYYPFRSKGLRFHTNSSFLQGRELITCGRVCVITKSYKDVLSLRSFGIQAVAPTTETTLLTKDDFMWLKFLFDYIVSCMDYGTTNTIDRTGRHMAWLLRKEYRIDPIMLTNGQFDTEDFGAKDFTDYVENNSALEAVDLLTKVHKPYLEDFNSLDKYYYKQLKYIK